MIRFVKTAPEPEAEMPKGYRFVLTMPDMPAFDFNDAAGIFDKHPRTGIVTHKYAELRDLDVIHINSVSDLLTIKRDFDPAALDQSFVTYGNNKLRFNEFFITPTYNGGVYDNEALADMVIRLMHRGRRKVACALEVTSEKGFYPGKENNFTFKRIRIRDTKGGAHRIVIPEIIIDRNDLWQNRALYREAFSRAGVRTLCGIASLNSGVHDNESVNYMRFHIRNLRMIGSRDGIPPAPTAPEDWVKNKGYPPIKPAPAAQLPPSFY